MAAIALPLMALIAVVVTLVTMNLWNWLLPPLFGWKTITFWQALGLLFLSRFLLGGFRGRPGWHRHWRHRMVERWQQMTPEERERFIAGLSDRCGRSEPPPAAANPTA
jgi:hypothetical protein